MDCSICLADLFQGGPLDVTPCGHPFHRCCLLQSLEFKKQCPLCKQPIREAQCHPLFLSNASGRGIQDLTQGPDIDELKAELTRLKDESRELLEYRKRARVKLKEQQTNYDRMMGELKTLANSFKLKDESRKVAEEMVMELQAKLRDQRRELEQLQTLVQLHNIRSTAAELPQDLTFSTPQQKDEYIRNQKQLLAWANDDLKELQREKRELAREREALQIKVETLTRKLHHLQTRAKTHRSSRERSPDSASPTKRMRVTPQDLVPEVRDEDQHHGSQQPIGDNSSVPAAAGPPPTLMFDDVDPTEDQSFIEILDSSVEEPAPLDLDLPTHLSYTNTTTSPVPISSLLPARHPPATSPSLVGPVPIARRNNSFIPSGTTDRSVPLPFGSITLSRQPQAFSTAFPIASKPERNYQPTLKSFLKKA